MKILGVCGSLRAQSRCRMLLDALGATAPSGMQWSVFPSLGNLPLFNPDLEPSPPESVLAWWQATTQADALVLVSPEYAHGISGVMKNGLDWLVGHPPFYAKPVALINPSHRAHHADAAIREVLRTMSVDLIEQASLVLPVIASDLTADQMTRDDELRPGLQRVFTALQQHAAEKRADDRAHGLL